jgi:hypothetical protein
MYWQNLLVALAVLASIAGIAGGYYAWRAVDGSTVSISHEKFRTARAAIRERSETLWKLSADMHIAGRPSLTRIGDSSMLIEDAMRPAAPLPLASVRVEWDESKPPLDPPFRKLSRRIMPKQTRWKKFASYSAAMGNLTRPTLFEDQPSFRIVHADWRAPDGPKLVLGQGTYFDLIDQAEALTHELSIAIRTPDSPPAWRRVPMRARLKADPLSLGSRVVLASVGTLTIRRTPDGQGTFFLLYRGVGKVATGEGTYNVLPGGMLQPASISPLAYRRDLSIWRNIMREYNEEMLGAPEAKGEGGIEVDYTEPPYSDFERALAEGNLRVWSFGMGLEAHNLTPCLLTIAVFEAHIFDHIFASLVTVNDEGTVISGPRHAGINGLPLREDEVAELLKSSKLGPPAAALLHLALEHQDLLLAPPAMP